MPPDADLVHAVAGRTVAVTGASGYIGSALCSRLAQLGVGVVRVTRSAQRLPPLPGVRALRDVEGSLLDAATWRQATDGAGAVIHLAGETSAVAAENDPAASWRDSVQPLGVLASVRAEEPVGAMQTLVLAGSATQYGLGETLPIDEAGPDAPASVYDLHKCEAERMARALEAHGVAVVSARLANVYGPGVATSSPDRGVLTKMVGRAMAGEPLRVFAPGTWLRDYIDIADVVDALIVLAVAGPRVPGGRALVCTGRSVPLLEAARAAARAAAEVTGVAVPVEVCAPPRALLAVETRQFQGEPARLASVGWQAKIELGDGLARTARALAAVKG